MTERAERPAAPLRLLVVDDSPYFRLRFARAFGRLPDVAVVGLATDGEEAVRLVASLAPNVVLLDLTLPGMDGFAVLRWIMANAPLPVVVCSARSDREAVFKALELGAIDYVVKPSGREDVAQVEPVLVKTVLAAASAHLSTRPVDVAPMPAIPPVRRRVGVVAIAASTGGPAAVQRLVRRLPATVRVPIVVAQHMPAGFTRLFAERLGAASHYTAVEARGGERLMPGTLYVAPGGRQTRIGLVEGTPALEVVSRDPSDVYAPSADQLFASAADAYGPAASAIVLTGMGDDGSRGARRVRAVGGYVLVESEETALIYGMPRAAIATGCVDAALPLERIADALALLDHG